MTPGRRVLFSSVLFLIFFTSFPGFLYAESRVKMSGKYRLAAGVGNEFIINDANADLQERNFRYVFGERLNNTFDPAIYQKFLMNVDFSPADPVNFYTQIVADPWSYVGTTGEQFTPSDIDGSSVLHYNLKYFGAFNSTLNQIFRSNNTDSVAFPIIKVKGDRTDRTVVHGFFDFNPGTNGVPFTIPELSIDYEFRPIRKMWLDWKADNVQARFFGLADESQALFTDDPLELSNHKDYWQESPWLYEYVPIQFFSDRSVRRGYYDNNVAFLARDSEGNRLVLLRGVSVTAEKGPTKFLGTVAAPFSPWDEQYSEANNIPGAFRLKHQLNRQWMLGGLFTFRSGLIDNSVADYNQVAAVDAQYDMNPDTTFKAEVARSNHDFDLKTDERLRSDADGYAYKAVAEKKIQHRKWDGETELHLSYAQMDQNFDPALSRYTNTRDDHFWGNHLTFQEYSPDLEHFRIGDGLDVNRAVVRVRWKEKMFKERFVNLIDLRNVHKTSNAAYKETVLRDEATYRITPNLTVKGLFRWQGLPKTTQNVEPFLANFYFDGFASIGNLNDPLGTLQNVEVRADRDPSRFTYAGALQYVVNSKWTVEGFLERTNDLPDFPRGLLNGTFRDANDRVDGLLFDHLTNFLFTQGPLGGVPPYEYFTVTRERIIYKPDDRVTVTFHAAQNGYKFATGIDDHINHQGISVAFSLDDKTTFFTDYTHSLQLDLPQLIATSSKISDFEQHHNVYASVDYKLSASQIFRAEYGVFGMGTQTPLVTPYSTTSFSLPTLDTEHLLRVSLTGDF